MPLIIVILQLWDIICLGCHSNGVYIYINCVLSLNCMHVHRMYVLLVEIVHK